MKISLNSQYAIRNELNCSYIVNISTTIDNRVDKNYDVTLIPPFIGFILSKFVGDNYVETIEKIAKELSISIQAVRNFTDRLVENDTMKLINWQNDIFYFPVHLLVQGENKANVRCHKSFNPFDEFLPHRPYIPFNVNMMVTTKCKTDCIYCYADRNKSDDLSIDKILHTIDEAYDLGVVNFTITGGDVFANKHWRSILKRLKEYGYHPFISTKVPLNEEDIKYLLSIGIKEIQFSLDTLDQVQLKNILRVSSNYKREVESMLMLCDKYELNLNIRTVLTRYNSTIESTNNLFTELQKYKVVKSWILTPAFYSAYKEHFENYSIDENRLEDILSFLKRQRANFFIYSNNVKTRIEQLTNYADSDDFVRKNKICNANTYSLSIISNGRVSICEMLYENPIFLIGNIKDKKLTEVWNSKRALELYRGIIYPNDKSENLGADIPDTSCTNCKSFGKCKDGFEKRICYVDIVNTYGVGKYHYPDPRCSSAENVNRNLII